MRVWLPLMVLVAGCKAYHQPLTPKPTQVKSNLFQYPSGMRVIFEQRPGSGRVAMALLVGAGSGSDPLGREGAAHFIEHLAFRSRPALRLNLGDELDFAGVASSGSTTANAATTVEETVYSGITSKERVASVLPLMASLVVQPLLGVDANALELERSIVRNEHLLRDAHGAGDVYAAIATSVFGAGVPGTRSVSGTTASITAITRADLEQFVIANYRPDATTVVLVGDYELEAIDALVRASFPPGWLSSRPEGAAPPRALDRKQVAVDSPLTNSTERPIVEAAIPRRSLVFAWSVPGTTEPGGSAVPLIAAGMRAAFRRHRPEGVEAVGTFVIFGPVRSIICLEASLGPKATPDAVSKAFRQRSDFGNFSLREWRDVVLSQLYQEQNLLEHAENRARSVFATNSTRTPASGVDEADRVALRYLETMTIKWPNAHEVLIAPLVKTNVALDAPPRELEAAPKRLVVQGDMVKSVALPPPLPEVKRFTLENGLQVVLSRRQPVPMVSVTLALPAGARHATRPVQPLLRIMLDWDMYRLYGTSDVPELEVGQDTTTVQLHGPSWNLPALLDAIGHNLSPRVNWKRLAYLEDIFADVIEATEEAQKKLTYEIPKRPTLLQQLMPPGSSYLSVPSDAVKRLSRSEFVDFVDLAFRPNGAALVIDGDFELEATEKIVRDNFESWSPVKDPLPKLRELGPYPSKQVKPSVVEAQESLTTKVFLMCRLPPATTLEMRGGSSLLAEALSYSFSEDLRETRGLTYGVYASATDFKNDDNVLSLTATLDPRGKQAALERFMQRLDALDGAVWDEQVVDVARWRLAKKYMGTVSTSPAVAEFLATELANGASYEDTIALPAKLSATALKHVDDAWSACNDTLAIEVVGERSSIEDVFKRRAKK